MDHPHEAAERTELFSKRRALHLSEVLQMARREGPGGPNEKYPEKGYIQRNDGGLTSAELAALPAGSLLLAGLWYRKNWSSTRG